MSRVVVAGGAGFLGSHLCDSLIERGDSVICLDDLSTGSRENVAHLLGHDRFSLVVTNVSEKVELTAGPRSTLSTTSRRRHRRRHTSPGPSTPSRSGARARAVSSSWPESTGRGS